ncbi:MAG: GNAT family N-acetyltransferase [Phycisphaerales bacterium]|nr:MAG: GNAT family N-acetyltransferase [Phycisphaerales bacterium]
MSTEAETPRIRVADENDLPVLHAVAARALCFDSFTEELLGEKLFRCPRPDRETFRVYLAERNGTPVGMMQSVSRPDDAKGWLGVFAVDAAHRRQGIATVLLRRVADDWRRARIRDVEVLAIPGNYFTPGLDPRYTEALCFLEHHGFERFKDCVNLLADLSDPFDTAGEEARLGKLGIVVRRADRGDGDLLDAFFTDHFGVDWRLEAELAMANDPPGLHLALKGGNIIAFSAHSGQNREWGFFGPMGTAPDARGTGIGRVLLWHCLNDLRDAGHRTSVIPWVGPIGFYSRYIPCRVERVFWRYRTAVSDPSMPAT